MKKKSTILLKRLVKTNRINSTANLFGGDLTFSGYNIINQNQYDPDLSVLNLSKSDLILYVTDFVNENYLELSSESDGIITKENFCDTEFRVTALAEDYLYIAKRDSTRVTVSYYLSIVAIILSLISTVYIFFQRN